MVSVDASGKTHVSLSEASRGSAAQRTASRDASGAVVGQSSGSNYVRQQEAARAAEQEQKVRDSITYNPELPAWASAPGETAGIDRSQLQDFKTKEELEREHSKSYRVKAAIKEGYKAGQGKEYNLKGLESPTLKAQDLKTYPLYEKSIQVSEKIDTVQNSILSRIPGQGIGKDVLTGVTNIPEMAVGAVGGLPLGLETIARNRGSVIDSTAFGLGVMAGGTVQKAKDNPGELAGEIIGSYALGRGLGSVERQVKPSFSRTGLKDFAVNERASWGSGERIQRRNPDNPLRQGVAQKQQLLMKEKTITAEPKIKTYVYAHGRLYEEGAVPKMQVTDIMTSGTKGKAASRASARSKTARGKVRAKQPEQIEILETATEPKTENIQRIDITNIIKPKTKTETILKPQQIIKNKPVEVAVPQIKELSLSANKLSPASMGLTSPLTYSLPFVSQGNIQRQTEKQTAEIKMAAVSLPAVSIPALNSGQLDQKINIQSPADFQEPYIPPVPIVDSTTKTDIINPPYIPQPSNYFPPNPFEGGEGNSFTPPPPFRLPGKIIPVILDDGLDFSEFRGSKPKRRKTKNKMLKNAYGDLYRKLF